MAAGSNNYTVKLWRLKSFACGHDPNTNRYLHLETLRTEVACVREEPVTDQSKRRVAKIIVVPPARLASLNFDCLEQIPMGFALKPADFATPLSTPFAWRCPGTPWPR